MKTFLRKLMGEPAQPPASEGESPTDTPLRPEDAALQQRVDQFQWYHRIPLNDRVRTTPDMPELGPIWPFITRACESVDFDGKKVLDIGCRDGMFSFMAERRGAGEILAVDNNLSRGMRELLIPHFNSSVILEELNLYDLDPARHGERDIIMLFGVLYHLRYPFWGLRKCVDCLAPDGEFLIETAVLENLKGAEEIELLYCPTDNSPYEKTSCTFFNARGLITTMESFGLSLVDHAALETNRCGVPGAKAGVSRQFFRFRNQGLDPEAAGLQVYWDKTHNYHTDLAKTRPREAG